MNENDGIGMENGIKSYASNNTWNEPPLAAGGSFGVPPNFKNKLPQDRARSSASPMPANGSRPSSRSSQRETNSQVDDLKQTPKKRVVEVKESHERTDGPDEIAVLAFSTGKRKRLSAQHSPATNGLLQVPQLTPSKRKSKRVKVSPMKDRRKQRESVLTRDIDVSSMPKLMTISQDDPTKFNEDICSACNGTGRFLCCESCPRSFHFTCLEPPIDEDSLPENSWFCNQCRTRRYPPQKPRRGLFSDMLDQMARRNPAQFQLPREIRTFFDGVETGEYGEYIDVHDLKPQKLNRSGFFDEGEATKLKDKQGDVILCFSCGNSGVDGRRIITCDYCNCHWHMDCVDPPLLVAPPANRRWMCQNHADEVLATKRVPKHHRVVDTALRRGLKNDGYIEINNDDDDVEFFERTTFENEFEIDGITYRLPERGVKLDFLDKVAVTTKFIPRGPSPPPASVDPTVEKVALSLTALRSQHFTQQTVAQLAELALSLHIAPVGTSPPGHLPSPALSESFQKPPIGNLNERDERLRLMAIRGLMQAKGKDALMRFLTSDA